MAVSNSVTCQIDGTERGFPRGSRQSRLGLDSQMNSSLFLALSHSSFDRIFLKRSIELNFLSVIFI